MVDDPKTIKVMEELVKALKENTKSLGSDNSQDLEEIKDSIKESNEELIDGQKKNNIKEAENRREEQREQKKLLSMFSGIGDSLQKFGQSISESIKEGVGSGFLKNLALGFAALAGGVFAFGENFAAVVQATIFGPIIKAFRSSFGVKIVEFIGKTVGQIGKVFAGVGKFFGPIMKAIKPIIKVASTILRPLTKLLPVVFKFLSKLFLPLNIVLGAIDIISGAISGFVNTEGTIVDKIKGSISGAFAGLLNFLTFGLIDFDYLKSFTDGIMTAITAPFDLIYNLFTGEFDIVDLFTRPVAALFDLITGGIASTVEYLNSTTVGDLLIPDGLAESTINFFRGLKVPEFAEGGIVSGSPQGMIARVAENNQAEAILPLRSFGDQYLKPSLDSVFNKYLGPASNIGALVNNLSNENFALGASPAVNVVAPQTQVNANAGGGNRVPIIAAPPARVQDSTISHMLHNSHRVGRV
jgi:phage-related protein